MVDKLQHSSLHKLKELRPITKDDAAVRILFVFDPDRQAVLLVVGDKSGNWKQWYADNIPVAENRYLKWLSGGYDNEED